MNSPIRSTLRMPGNLPISRRNMVQTSAAIATAQMAGLGQAQQPAERKQPDVPTAPPVPSAPPSQMQRMFAFVAPTLPAGPSGLGEHGTWAGLSPSAVQAAPAPPA